MSESLNKINMITDNDIMAVAEKIFGIDTSNKEDETIKFETHFGTIHVNKNNIK